MAKVVLENFIKGISGSIGGMVFKKQYGHQLMSAKPDRSGVTFTEKQLKNQDRFKTGTIYGKMALADPLTRALYEAEAKDRGMPVFAVVVADFFNAPSVEKVDLSGYQGSVGDRIVISAHDDFSVVRVTVEMVDTEGNLIETGEAVEEAHASGIWVYHATAAVAPGTDVRMNVTAFDRPGGTGAATEEKTV